MFFIDRNMLMYAYGFVNASSLPQFLKYKEIVLFLEIMGVTAILEITGTGKGSIQTKFDELNNRIKRKLDAQECKETFCVNLHSFVANHETPMVLQNQLYNQGSRTSCKLLKKFKFIGIFFFATISRFYIFFYKSTSIQKNLSFQLCGGSLQETTINRKPSLKPGTFSSSSINNFK